MLNELNKYVYVLKYCITNFVAYKASIKYIMFSN